jgi:hypothetical protein
MKRGGYGDSAMVVQSMAALPVQEPRSANGKSGKPIRRCRRAISTRWQPARWPDSASARLQRNERLLDSFPTTFVERRLRPMDRAPVSRLYRNWLSYLRARKRLASRSSASPQQHRGDAPQPAEGVS